MTLVFCVFPELPPGFVADHRDSSFKCYCQLPKPCLLSEKLSLIVENASYSVTRKSESHILYAFIFGYARINMWLVCIDSFSNLEIRVRRRKFKNWNVRLFIMKYFNPLEVERIV